MDSRQRLVVGLGEALFDCFENRQIAGGAPLNVAFHANQLLKNTDGSGAVASRVGDDTLGRRLVQEIQSKGMATEWLQKDADRPTGTVQVDITAGDDALYHISENVAWDQLEFTPQWKNLAARCDAVVFGTLAQRSETSRRTIHDFLNHASGAIRLFDVNLRADFYSDPVVRESLQLATALKVNMHELQILRSMFSSGNSKDHPDSVRSFVQELKVAFDLDWIALTNGEEGTKLFTGTTWIDGDPPKIPFDKEADSVGAGDACCAALIVGRLLDWSPKEMVRAANFAGASVASRQGATVPVDVAALIEFTLGNQ